MSVSKRMGPVEWALLATLSVLWGGSFFFVKVALRELPPFVIVQCRVLVAALALLCLLKALGLSLPRGRAAWKALFAMALLNNVIPFSCIVWGQTLIGSGLAAILNSATPLFTVLAAHCVTQDEKLSAARLSGVLLGMAGVAVLLGMDTISLSGASVVGQAAVLAAAVSYTFAALYGRRFAGQPPLVVATGQVCASSLMMTPLTLMMDSPWTLAFPGAATLASVAGLALASTALAYVLYFRILARAGAANLSLVTLLIPVSAVTLGCLVLGETIIPGQAAGMALIFSGLATIDGRLVGVVRRAVCGGKLKPCTGDDYHI